MKQVQEDFPHLYRIARSYYIDGLTQEEIAARESISRPHVSRLLAKARDCGIVTVDVTMPTSPKSIELENYLKKSLGLIEVKLACVPQHVVHSSQATSLAIATLAAIEVPKMLTDVKTLGIGWGYTIYQTSVLIDTALNRPDMKIVPLVGLAGIYTPYLQINVIVNRFAEKWRATSIYTLMPVLHEYRFQMGSVEKLNYQLLRDQWNKLDCAIVGLGAVPREDTLLLPEAPRDYNESLMKSDTVGDILANFFYADGTVFDSSNYHFQVSLPLEALKRVDQVICLAGGVNKVDGLVAAARNGFYNVLFTDVNTATLMKNKIEREGDTT
jgi:DNA-binding transcriptional regulator LsrR (DeoR family)